MSTERYTAPGGYRYLLPPGTGESPEAWAVVVEREADRQRAVADTEAASWLEGYAACLRSGDGVEDRDLCEDEDHEGIERERREHRETVGAVDAARGLIKRMGKMLDRSGTLKDDMDGWLAMHPIDDTEPEDGD